MIRNKEKGGKCDKKARQNGAFQVSFVQKIFVDVCCNFVFERVSNLSEGGIYFNFSIKFQKRPPLFYNVRKMRENIKK